MLGRQQIAGIQNALSELFKNAHDAYATQALVDYFEDTGPNAEGFIVIRDNGVGMTKDDFENKWLVLGTESKTGKARAEIYRPPSMARRPITGEKGIGRLAIALLGRQVLILTRAERENGRHDLVAALIHWGLFEIPGLDLEQIEIPVLTFPGGTLPSTEDISRLREQLKACAERIQESDSELDIRDILEEIDGFDPDPVALDEFFAPRDKEHISLRGHGTGTHFLIGPSNPIIKIDLEMEQKRGDYGFRKHLLGFFDTVFVNNEFNRGVAVEGSTTMVDSGSDEDGTKKITTSFRRWLPGDLIGEDILDPSTFFTEEEFLEKADHALSGFVDAFGQFRGTLRVYDHVYEDLIVPWSDSNGRATKCGPFTARFGYVMGYQNESKLSQDEWFKLTNKLNHLGGLYMYRDRVRILPYGDYGFDWLDVEKRRNKGAGYYFFSYRRMFGAVLLTRQENSELQEKAGREGFQQNEAYKQIRDILMNLLVQLASEFFRKDGRNTETFEKIQDEIKRKSKALERQQKQATTKRKNFANALATFSHETGSGLPDTAIANLRKLTKSRMEAASQILDQDKAAAALIRAEQEAVTKLNELRTRYTCRRPSGVAFTKELAREWEGYLAEKERLEKEVFDPFEEEIARTLGEVAKQARVYIDQRKRLEERIKQLADERKKELADASRQANATASDTRQTVFSITEKARQALDQTICNIQADLNRTDLSALPQEEIEQMRKRWEEELTGIEVRHRDALMAAKDMLASLAENLRSSDGEEPAQIMEALEQRMLSLEEQADEDFEMVQLGLAVAIINHEFAASIHRIRRSIQELGHISRSTTGLKPLYESIRNNFEHLDGHLNLFTPLQRRLNRSLQKINGKKIRNYVNDVFFNRIERHKVKLECTEAFLSSEVECYLSTLYPAIINLVDNALYWLSTVNNLGHIRLDAGSGALIIANNGPEIETRDWQRIFERGFSRKLNGRGLGLFISAKALQAENMILSLTEPPEGFNVAFRIAIEDLRFTS